MLMLASLSALALTPEQQREDFDQLWAALEATHPSLYLYTPQPELEAKRSEVLGRMDVERGPMAFWALLMESVEPIGCGHTFVMPGEAALDELENQSHNFPLDLVVNSGELHVDPRMHPEGGRIVSIEGVSGSELLDRLRGLTNSDGRSTPFQDWRIDESSPIYVPALVGPRSSYELELETLDGTAQRTVPGIADWVTQMGNGPQPPTERERLEVHAVDAATGESLEPSRQNLPGRAVLVTLDDFPEKGFRKAVIRPMRRALRQDVVGLIIDLRRNGGGSPWSAFDLLGHLLPSEVPSYDQRLWKWTHYVRVIAGDDDAHEQHLLEPETMAERGVQSDEYDQGYGDNAMIPRRRPHYDGPVIVLTSGNTFSTGADVAAFVKREGRGQIIGQTTGGSATLQTSGASDRVDLTHSGVRASIPWTRSRLADPHGRLADSVGVKPDLVVEPSIEELREGADPILRAALATLAR